MTERDQSQEKNSQTHRAYKCPNCEGEFDEWYETAYAGPDECPFCGLGKGRYNG